MFDLIMNYQIRVLSLIFTKEKRWRKVLDGAKVHRDFWQSGPFSTRIFYFIFGRFSDFSKVSNNHLGISKFFSQKGHLDFSFSTLELVVDIALSLSISFRQKHLKNLGIYLKDFFGATKLHPQLLNNISVKMY